MKINQFVEIYFKKYKVSGKVISITDGVTLVNNQEIIVIRDMKSVLFYKIKQEVNVTPSPQPQVAQPMPAMLEKIEQYKNTGAEKYGSPGLYTKQASKHNSNKKV